MQITRRIRQILAGSIQSTKSIGNKTKSSIQSALRLKKSKKQEKKPFAILGNPEASSQLQLVFNEERDSLDEDSSWPTGGSSGSADLGNNQIASILFEEVRVDIIAVTPDSYGDGSFISSNSRPIPSRMNSFQTNVVQHPLPTTASRICVSGETDPIDSRSTLVNVSSNQNGLQSSGVADKFESSIQVISTEQVSKVKLRKRRLSVKSIRKSGKRVRKILTSGFKAMGNSMIYATHAIPVAYECPVSTSYYEKSGTTAQQWTSTNYPGYEDDEEVDRRKYMEFWSHVLKQREADSHPSRHHRLDTCHSFQLR